MSLFFTSRQWDWKKQTVDQLAHAGVAVAILLPVMLIANPVIGCALSGLVAGTLRELEQAAKADSLHLFDRTLDAAFFAVGGALLGLFFR